MSPTTFQQVERLPVSVGEAAKRLGCTREAVFRLVHRGPLVGILYGRQAPLYVCGGSLADVRAVLDREPLS